MKMKKKIKKADTRKILGVILILIGVFTAVWNLDRTVWTTSIDENWEHYKYYRGIEIEVWMPLGIVYGTSIDDEWTVSVSCSELEGLIDDWLGPEDDEGYWEHDSIYREIEILRWMPGATYYSATFDDEWHIEELLTDLEGLIDDWLDNPPQSGLEGRWWVNDVEITTDPDQRIILNTATMKFKFEPTTGRVSSVTVSWIGTETGSRTLTKDLLSNKWRRTLYLSEGSYTVTLHAEGADGELSLSLIGSSSSTAKPYVFNLITGGLVIIGLFLIVGSLKKTKKEKTRNTRRK